VASPITQNLSDKPTHQDNRLFIVGGGGHAKVVIEVARSAGWDVVAVFDPGQTKEVLGVPVHGSDDDIKRFIQDTGVRTAAIAIGNNHLRRRLALKVRSLGCDTPVLLHERAWVSPTAWIGPGVVVMAGAIINADARIGEDAIVNTMAIVEHDCILGAAVHAAPRSVMGGTCIIGDATLFGIGATARPGIAVGKDTVIGAGCVVVADVGDSIVLVGNPGVSLTARRV
jgi:UDP-perosamine 4-acetyltransferase